MAAETTQDQGGGSAAPSPAGQSAEIEAALGAPIDTGAGVPDGVTQAASPAPASPSASEKGAETIPMKRFQAMVAERNKATDELQNLRVQNARSEADAQAWRALNADPTRAAALQRILSGQQEPMSEPVRTSVRAEDFHDDPERAMKTLIDETARRIRAESQQQLADLQKRQAQYDQYLMGVLTEVNQTKADSQRAQLKEAYPNEYDPAVHDAPIAEKMRSLPGLSMADAFVLVRGSATPSGPAPSRGSQAGENFDPSEVVEPPSGVPSKAMQSAQADMNRALALGDETAATRAMEQMARASGEIERFSAGG